MRFIEEPRAPRLTATSVFLLDSLDTVLEKNCAQDSDYLRVPLRHFLVLDFRNHNLLDKHTLWHLCFP